MLSGAPPAWAADDDCALDQEQQRRTASALASRHAGATHDVSQGLVRWLDARLGVVSVQVGGCEHFGLSVSSERRAATPSTEAEWLRHARLLVQMGWPRPYAKDALKALERPRWRIRSEGANEIFEIDVPGYDEFLVERRFENGHESLAVRAILTT